MIEAVEFRNFKVLRGTTLPLSRFTLLVGPNGSGKSTALQAFQVITGGMKLPFYRLVPIDRRIRGIETDVQIVLRWGSPYEGIVTRAHLFSDSKISDNAEMFPLEYENTSTEDGRVSETDRRSLSTILHGIRIYTLNASSIRTPVMLQPNMELDPDGGQLAGVLDRLRDYEPERFEALNKELGRWLPEYDRVLFDTPGEGQRAFLLRTRQGHHKIHAEDLSQGTLLALALLTLVYLPDPPSMVCLEEPDRGLHPRLLRDVQDALYRLSYPESTGEEHQPVQVLATTHSPYFLDLYRDHREEVVIASRTGQEARFERLSDHPDIDKILGDAPLSEVWYSGILGGVPAEP